MITTLFSAYNFIRSKNEIESREDKCVVADDRIFNLPRKEYTLYRA